MASVDSTKEMADLLQAIANGIEAKELGFIINEKRAEMMHGVMESMSSPLEREMAHRMWAGELLNSGKTQEAIAEFTKVRKWMEEAGDAVSTDEKCKTKLLLATAYLRLAEQQNCCAGNAPDACLMPIRGTGIHTLREGSTHAIKIFKEVLSEQPDDQLAKWLLNIASMTLDEYPNGVPAKWRIPPSAFKSDYDIKRFPNIAKEVGLDLLGLAGGSIVDDLDGDGYLDVMISGHGFQDQLRFFHNNGNATFTERTKEAKLIGETGGLNLLQTDYNNDGNIDVYVLRGGWMGAAGRFPSSLLRNNGDGTFTDVSKQAGLMRAGPTQAAVWLDYNNDGFLDLYVGYESGATRPHPCALYRNNKNGTFTDIAKEAGVNQISFVKSVVSADYDKDGWPDLFLSSMGLKTLYHNNGNGTFTDVTAQAGISQPNMSFGSFFFDYDNDGWADLFVMDYSVQDVTSVMLDIQKQPAVADTSHCYRNNGNGTFTDVTAATHLNKVILGKALNFGDLDNDGYLDFYAGTGNPDLIALIPNRMFRNAGGKYFQEVTTSGNFGHLQKGHGISFADINNDGNQDVFAKMGAAYSGDTAYSSLYANPGHGNHWITLKLEGVQTNRAAIGARIKVVIRDAKGTHDIYKTVGSGASFGCNPFRQEIGLGQATSIEKVEIYWPVSRKTQNVQGVALDKFFAVKEDKDIATPIKLKATSWAGALAKMPRANTKQLAANGVLTR